MHKSSFFNAIISTDGVPDRAYLAEDFARYFNSFIGNGVFPNPSTCLQVVAVDNNMDIRLRAGKGWINGYFYENTDDYTLKIDVADGVLNRIDRVVLRLDFLNREIKSYVKKGAYSSTPIAPILTKDADMYELGIADIAVNKGIIKITQADITDLRFNTSLCGIVKGVVDQIDTTNLFAQYQSQFDIWFVDVKNKLGGDIAGSLQNQITAILESKGKPNGIATLDSDSKIPILQLPRDSVIFPTPGIYSWTVPKGVTEVWVSAIAGGGGGGGQGARGGTTSAGGTGGAGGVTSFGTHISLTGGGGGQGSSIIVNSETSVAGSPGLRGKAVGAPSLFVSDGIDGEARTGGGGAGVFSPAKGSGGEGGLKSGYYNSTMPGGGGGSGSYCSDFLVAGLIENVITITIGAGGVGGTASDTRTMQGSNGGDGFMIIKW